MARARPSVLVVGAATGLGAAGARALAAEGWRLALLDRSATALSRTAVETGAAFSAVVDARRPAELTAAIEEAARHLDGLDAVWSNVGVMRSGDVHECSVEDFDLHYEVNLRSAFVTARACVPLLRARGGGSILVTASNAAIQTETALLAYATTKAAVAGLVRCMARDHARDGIRVNALCPGLMDTSFNAPLWERAGGRAAFESDVVPALVPLGRQATPEEIARQAVFLLSNAGSFVTGHCLVVDGAEHVTLTRRTHVLACR